MNHVKKGLGLGLNIRKKPNPSILDEDPPEKTKFQLGRKLVANQEFTALEKTDETVAEELQRIQSKHSQKSINMVQDALNEDANLFDYDAAYDGLKAQELYAKRQRDGVQDGSGQKKARYMEQLINSANERKKYLERAKERKLQAEREAEGDVFGNKEEFVTQAYLDKQKQLQEEEEAEKKQQEKERLDAASRDRPNAAFYRNLLDKRTAGAPLVLGDSNMSAALLASRKEEQDKEEEKLKKLQLASDSGLVLNDNAEVVDKRQLLTGGLNISSKAIQRKQLQEAAARDSERERREKDAQIRKREAEKRREADELARRHTVMALQQKERIVRQATEKEASKEKTALETLTKTSLDSSGIQDAKARYLARKAATEKKAD
ncbi:hypothetical protein HDV03_000737 [Kappamyces sp. JEL0829]|nr:hypothetical protein HDV03_000737 [Kappamyces sp. JEL0829]